nr:MULTISPECIES: hypothetical protein [unclassified Parafrankia]
MRARPVSTAANDSALRPNTQAAPGMVPAMPMSPPAAAGPAIRPALKIMLFSATAFGSSGAPTISTMNACRMGASKEVTTPSRPERTKSIGMRSAPEAISAHAATDSTAAELWVISSSRSLGNRSATTPA